MDTCSFLTHAYRSARAELSDRFSTQARWPDRFPGAYLGMGGRDPVFTGAEHAALIIGPPRSGKTTSIVIPALTLWPGPAVATSTKADVLCVTAASRAGRGKVMVWDPTAKMAMPEGVEPLRWSPLLGCADWDSAIERAWMLTHAARPDPVGDALHWTERAGALLAALLHAAALAGQPMSKLLEWIHSRSTWDALDQLAIRPGSAVAHHLLSGINQTDSRELSGIWSTADSVLAAYRSPALLYGADHPNFDPAAFARSTDTVHLVAPGPRAGQYAPAICALLDQIRSHATDAAVWRDRPPMLWALDEMANIAPLPNMAAIVADSGSQGLVVLGCLQDLSQARQRWGTSAEGLLTLFATTLLLPGIADPATLKTVTTLAGKVDRPQYSIARTGLIQRTHTTSTRPLPLLPENVIAQGKTGLALHVRGAYPSWLRLTPHYSTPWIAAALSAASTAPATAPTPS